MTRTAFTNRAFILPTLLALLALAWPGTAAMAAEFDSTPRAATWVTNGTVWAMAVTPTTIYIGGDFTQVGPATSSPGSPDWVSRNRLAAINAATGQATDWNPGADAGVRALAVVGTTVYVGGMFTTAGGQARSNIAAINTATGLAIDWNPGVDGPVSALAVLGGTLYFGGAFTDVNGQARGSIAAFDTATGTLSSWNPNAGSPVYALAASGTTVYISGWFTYIGGQVRKHIAALDAATGLATDWNPGTSGRVYALAVSGTTLYAGGDFTDISSFTRSRIAALDTITGNATAWNPSADNIVRALAVSGTTIYVGGDFTTIGGQSRNCLAAVDATTGLATDWNPNPDSSVLALALSETSLFAGGFFGNMGGPSRPNFAEFLDSAIDTTPPTGTIVISNNRLATKTVNVALSLGWDDGVNGSGVTRMRFSDNGTTWTPWEALKYTRVYTLPSGDGYKTVRVQYMDIAGNRSLIYNDYIRLDTVAPTGSILINNNASTTTSRNVSLNLAWADVGAGVTRMRFSIDGQNWTAWESIKRTRAYTLPATLGYYTVRVQYTDAAENYSPIYKDYIKLIAP